MTRERPDPEPEMAGAKPEKAPGAGGADPARRGFFRSFSRDAVQMAAQATGTVAAVQRGAGTAIGTALGLIPVRTEGPVPAAIQGIAPPPPASVPAPYRVEDDALVLVDQQRLPDALVELRCTDPYQLATQLLGRHVLGAPLLAQVTAYGLWLAALGARGAPAVQKRNRIRAAGASLRAARSHVATIPWAVDRMVASWDAAAALGVDGPTAEEMAREAADGVATEIGAAVSRIARSGADAAPPARSERLEIVTLDSTGRLAGGDRGTALGIVQRLAADGRPVHVWLLETRPLGTGARLARWELELAGVAVTLIPDASIGWLLTSRPIDLVLVGADRIAGDGAATAVIGTYALASLARQHAVPVWVAAPLAVFDPSVAGAHDSSIDQEPFRVPDQGASSGGRGPLQDVTPTALIDALVTEAGLLRPPFGPALTEATSRESH